MKSLKVWKELAEILERGKDAVLVIVAESSGSSPGKAGFKMIVTDCGQTGTIGGGATEYEATNIAREMLAEGAVNNVLLERVHNPAAPENSSGMICGGMQKMCLVRFTPKQLPLLQQIYDIAHLGGIAEFLMSRYTVTVREVNEKHASCFNRYSLAKESETDWQYGEIIRGKTDIAYIIGGGHVCQALVPLLESLEFMVVVIDEREYIASRDFGNSEVKHFPFADAPYILKEGERSFVFVMTPGHAHDEAVLRGIIGRKFGYIGLVSSRAKWKEMSARLLADGYKESDIDRVHAPIGLPIQSHTAAEIAISIAAEVVSIRNAK